MAKKKNKVKKEVKKEVGTNVGELPKVNMPNEKDITKGVME